MDTFSLGGVVARTRRIFGLHPIGFLVLAVLITGVPALLGPLLLTSRIAALQAASHAGQPTPFGDTAAIFVFTAAPGIVTYVGGIVLTGLIATAAWRDVEGRAADFGASLRGGLAAFLPLLAISLLSALGITLGMILLFVPGVILVLMWFVALPACVVERPGILAAFGRSRALTAGYRWRIFGISLLYWLVFGVVFLAVTFGTGLLSRGSAVDGPVPASALVTLIAAALVRAFFQVVSAAGYCAIYIELRRAKEGYLSRDLVEAFS